MKEFANRVAVITGAASGFGREFALSGARLGMKLVLADVQQAALETFRAELAAQGVAVLAVRCDVRKAEEVQALADAALAEFGAVHLLFNNAGVGAGGLIWENTQADWEWVLGVNLWGVIHGVRLFTPLMLECARRDADYRGYIVNTASMAGLLTPPTMGVYNVSKHAVVALSETLYQDLQLVDAPIGTSVLCPYFVPTAITQSAQHRPAELRNSGAPTLSQQVAGALLDKAVTSGKVSAKEVAEWTFQAIREERFYIFSHPEALGNVEKRMQAILQQHNPADPYEALPQVREMLKAKLKAAAADRA